MAFFDELGAKISRAGSSAVQKTQEVTEIARLNGQITNEEKKIQNLCQQIGNLYFQKYKDNPDPDFINMVSEIFVARENIQSCRERILQIKDQVICPACGSPVTRGSAFCSECGNRLQMPAAAQPVQTEPVQHCASCGQVLNPGSRFCPRCGTPAPQPAVVQSAPLQPAAAQPAPVFQNAAPEENLEETIIYSADAETAPAAEEVSAAVSWNDAADSVEAGAFLEQSAADTADEAGMPLNNTEEADHPDTEPALAASAEEEVLICPNCGKKSPADRRFCGQCGTPLSSGQEV